VLLGEEKTGLDGPQATDRVALETFAQYSYSCEPPEAEYLSAPLWPLHNGLDIDAQVLGRKMLLT